MSTSRKKLLNPSGASAEPANPAWQGFALLSAIAVLAGAWVAAGSTGLLGHPLRHAITWVAAGLAIVTGRPDRGRWPVRLLTLAAAVAVFTVSNVSALPPVNVLGLALMATVLAWGRSEAGRRPLLLTAATVATFGLYRLAFESIPWVWMASDWLAGALGRLAGGLSGQSLWVGPSLAGTDYLLTMLALLALGLVVARPRRIKLALVATGAILVGQMLYLIVLSYVPRLLAAMPPPPPPPPAPAGPTVAPWSWTAAVSSLMPWNMPVLAGAIQLAIAAVVLWRIGSAEPPGVDVAGGAGPTQRQRFGRLTLMLAAAILAAALPAVATLSTHRPNLRGKKIVLFEKGFLNWLRPTHNDYGRLSIGMYGMLPDHIESLGAKCVVSPDLSEADLDGADALIMMFPNKPWAPGQLERIWAFVRNGGTLLVFGEHTVRESDGGCRFNEVLAPTAMRVRFDSALFEIGGWLQSYQALGHPTTAGVPDDRNQFGVVIGASVDARLPAWPFMIGRWGWNDLGDPGNEKQAMMGNRRYDPGERLGDIVLAAEQPLGAGRVICFGDPSSVTNGIMIGAHVYVSRLLGYVGDPPADPQAPWRQAAGLLLAVGAMVLLGWRADLLKVGLVAAAAAAALVLCTSATHRAAELLPSGRAHSPNNLAYIDASHVESYSEESLRNDGLMGLTYTLMRNGYLTLLLPETAPERLNQAGLFISVAPTRAFSAAERQAVRDFVENGGIFISTVGYEEREASQELLADFGFSIGGSPPGVSRAEPKPMGHFKAPYLNVKAPHLQAGHYMPHVRFHAAWPVQCTDPQAQVVAYGPENLPVILMRRIGRGKVVVIGDTGFAMNKNLEHEGGEPFEGLRENADFWRWFLAYLTDQPSWIPPPPPGAAPATTQPATRPATQGEVSP